MSWRTRKLIARNEKTGSAFSPDARRALLAPGLRLHRLPQRDGLADLVLAGDLHVAQVGERAGEQLRHGPPGVALDAAQQRGEVAEVAPHQLRAEDAVLRRALLERPLEVALVAIGLPQRVGLRHRPVGHLPEGEPLDDVGVAVRVEVLVRAAAGCRSAGAPRSTPRDARRARSGRGGGRGACCRCAGSRRRDRNGRGKPRDHLTRLNRSGLCGSGACTRHDAPGAFRPTRFGGRARAASRSRGR